MAIDDSGNAQENEEKKKNEAIEEILSLKDPSKKESNKGTEEKGNKENQGSTRTETKTQIENSVDNQIHPLVELQEIRERCQRLGNFSTKARSAILFLSNFHAWALKQVLNHVNGIQTKDQQIEPVQQPNQKSFGKVIAGVVVLPGMTMALGHLLPATGSIFGMFTIPYAPIIKIGFGIAGSALALKNLSDVLAFKRVDKRTTNVMEEIEELLNEQNEKIIEEDIRDYAKALAERLVNLAAHGNNSLNSTQQQNDNSIESIMNRGLGTLNSLIQRYKTDNQNYQEFDANKLLLEEIEKSRRKGRIFAWLRFFGSLIGGIVGAFGLRALFGLFDNHDQTIQHKQGIQTEEKITETQNSAKLTESTNQEQLQSNTANQSLSKPTQTHAVEEKISSDREIKINKSDQPIPKTETLPETNKQQMSGNVPINKPITDTKDIIAPLTPPKATVPEIVFQPPEMPKLIDPFELPKDDTVTEDSTTQHYESYKSAEGIKPLNSKTVSEAIDPLAMNRISEEEILEASRGKVSAEELLDKDSVQTTTAKTDDIRKLIQYIEENKDRIDGKTFEEIVKNAKLEDNEIAEQVIKSFQEKQGKLNDESLDNFKRLGKIDPDALTRHVETMKESRGVEEKAYDIFENKILPKDVRNAFDEMDTRRYELSNSFKDAKIPGNDEHDLQKYRAAEQKLREANTTLRNLSEKYMNHKLTK
ncbi:MAG: hypothetical protein N3E37_00270 [Candidatus Micrarchaeota archaeon]|nr:hypothetical protein [Candidatus Micrarchaeota archaeon]